MRNQRVVIVSVAVVLALIAAFATWRYLGSADERAQKDVELVDAYVVTQDIPKDFPGDRAIDEQHVTKDKVPLKIFPAGGIVDIQTIRGKVSSVALRAGEVLVDTNFIDIRQASSSLSQKISPGLQAITISIDRIKGVGGFIQPGDRVNIIVTATVKGADAEITWLMLQNVRVLLVGAAVEQQVGATPPPPGQVTTPTEAGLITFEVSTKDAQKIAHAVFKFSGGIYLTLVPQGYQPAPVPSITDVNLL